MVTKKSKKIVPERGYKFGWKLFWLLAFGYFGALTYNAVEKKPAWEDAAIAGGAGLVTCHVLAVSGKQMLALGAKAEPKLGAPIDIKETKGHTFFRLKGDPEGVRYVLPGSYDLRERDFLSLTLFKRGKKPAFFRMHSIDRSRNGFYLG